MMAKIKFDDACFSVRVGAIMYNKDKTHILMQQPDGKDFWLSPGGRLEIGEEINVDIARELDEELGLENEKLDLKIIMESFIKLPNKMNYHEVGFYYVTTIDENKYGYDLNKAFHPKDEEHDVTSIFKWLKIDELSDYIFFHEALKNKIINLDNTNNIEHIIYQK